MNRTIFHTHVLLLRMSSMYQFQIMIFMNGHLTLMNPEKEESPSPHLPFSDLQNAATCWLQFSSIVYYICTSSSVKQLNILTVDPHTTWNSLLYTTVYAPVPLPSHMSRSPSHITRGKSVSGVQITQSCYSRWYTLTL